MPFRYQLTVLICCLSYLLSAQTRSRADSVVYIFDEYFWSEEGRHQGFAMLEDLYAADVAAGRRDTATAKILSGLGQFKLGIDNEHTAAARYHRSALELGDSLYAAPHAQRAAYRMYLAELYIKHDPYQAERILRESIAELRQLPVVDNHNIQGNYWNLSRSFMALGEYQPARDAIELALDDWRNTAEPNPYNGARLYNQLSIVLGRFGREPELAVTAAERSLELARTTNYEGAVAYGLNSLGISLLQNEQVEAADSVFREMDKFVRGMEDPSQFIGTPQNNLSQTSRLLGRPAEALAYAETALAARKTRTTVGWYGPLANIALSQLDLGRYADAVATVNEGMENISTGATTEQSGRTVPQPDSIIDYELLLKLIEVRIGAFEGLNEPDKARADYQLLFEVQEAMRRQGQDPLSRRLLSNDFRPYQDGAVTLIHSQRNRNEEDNWEAFGLSEAARGFSLLADLREKERQRAEQEAELRSSIAAYERITNPLAGEARQLALDRDALQEIMLAARAEASGEREEFAVRDYLEASGSSVVEFHVTDSAYYAFTYTPEAGLSFDQLGDRATLDSLSENWLKALKEGAYQARSLRAASEQNRFDKAFATLGKELYKRLFTGLDGNLPEQLIIVPDGPLNFLPFAALPTGTAGYGDYLGQATNLQQAYSLRHLAELDEFSSPEEKEHSVVVMAPTFAGSASPLYASRARGTVGLQALTHNLKEASAINALLDDVTLLTGPEANRARFFELAEQSSVLHLSSHGAVDPTDPNLSFIAFTQTSDTLQSEELLYFNDLTVMDLNADLVTLSACETNLGEVAPGENVLSMGAAFLAAGARSTVSSLWQVDDRATTYLMADFYKRLAAGEDRVAALSGAQQSMLEGEYAHPFYWAAFVLTGTDGRVAVDTAFSFPWVWVLLSMVLGGLVGWLIDSKRARSPVP